MNNYLRQLLDMMEQSSQHTPDLGQGQSQGQMGPPAPNPTSFYPNETQQQFQQRTPQFQQSQAVEPSPVQLDDATAVTGAAGLGGKMLYKSIQSALAKKVGNHIAKELAPHIGETMLLKQFGHELPASTLQSLPIRDWAKKGILRHFGESHKNIAGIMEAQKRAETLPLKEALQRINKVADARESALADPHWSTPTELGPK